MGRSEDQLVEEKIILRHTGACPGFLKGGGPISLGSLKKSSDFKRGGGPMV